MSGHIFIYNLGKRIVAQTQFISTTLVFVTEIHREIVPPRETVPIARVAIAIVGRGGWGSLPYTVANENQMKA